MRESFNERLRHIAPYPDIIRQVEENFHGKGGYQRAQVTSSGSSRFGLSTLSSQAQYERGARI